MTGFAIALALVVWLYTIVAIHNGGGFVTTVAILSSFLIAFAGLLVAFYNGELIWGWGIIMAIVIGFMLQIRARDDGLLN